jgi:hypothetical protein
MLRHVFTASSCMVIGCCLARFCFGAVTVPAQAEPGTEATETTYPETESSATTRTVSAKAAPRAARRLVFSCQAPGLLIFSDRPCGPAAATRELRVDAPAEQNGRGASVAPERARVSMRSTPDRPAGADSPLDPDAKPDICQRLQEAVAALDAHMRNGYSAREAGRLWDRWREAKSRLREARC